MFKTKMSVRILLKEEGKPKKKFKTKRRVDSDGTEHRIDVFRKKNKKTVTYHTIKKKGKVIHHHKKN